MVDSVEKRGVESGLAVERLLTGDETLFGVPPSEIAEMVAGKLNAIEASGRSVRGVVAIPDSHAMGLDGGVKDITIIVDNHGRGRVEWRTTTLLDDGETYYHQPTDYINEQLLMRIQELRVAGSVEELVVPIIDSHHFVRYSGRDGLKDFVICYHQ